MSANQENEVTRFVETTVGKVLYFCFGAVLSCVATAIAGVMLTASPPDRDVTKAERDFVYDCMRFKTGSPSECRDVAAELFDGACPELPPVLVELDENGVPLAPMCDCSAEDWSAYEEGRAHGRVMCEAERRLP